ncbi:MAG: lysophospholipid acyltransferase family protein [Muribaculaceae bacterium]|nr:lysophospholipid acyltransferase family protein [Muribaculaceae bacterium]
MNRPLLWLLKGLAMLPFGVLYLIADALFVIMYYIVRYRRSTVIKNICESFPEKSMSECRAIARRFYHNFADLIVETIKLENVSDEQMRSRMIFEGVDIIDNLLEQGRSITAYFAHCGNWEWATSVTLWSRFKPNAQAVFSQVYRPLSNKFFDDYFLHLRSRFNTVSFPKTTVFRELVKLRRDKLPVITGFMSDQKPSRGDTDRHVVMFLNHPTAVITGTEQLSRKLDNAVVYWDMHREGRGKYRVVVRLITDDISSMQPMEVTDRYVQMLSQTINRDPSIWLWSHKRWKNPVTFHSESVK